MLSTIRGLPRIAQKRLAKFLGAGTLAACDEETTREIGFRDLGSGALTRD